MPLSQNLLPLKETYIDIYDQLRKENRWTDKKILMMTASVYVTSEKVFDIHRYEKLCDAIKSEAGLFSYLKSPLRYSVAAMLDLRFDDSLAAFHNMMKVYDSMIENGFNRSPFTYLAAAAMLREDLDGPEMENKVRRAVAIHKSMKQEHPFLTSQDDYPLAALLAEREEEIETVIDQVEYFYRSLDRNGFSKSNELQFLSHMLSLDETHTADELVERTIHAADMMKKSSIRFKRMLYPEAGLLALIGDADRTINEWEDFKTALDQESSFRWHKDLNGKVAANIIVSSRLQDSDTFQTGLFTSLETLLQAQQVAVYAGTMAAVSAGDGGGGAN
ncbi:DUF4003 domain-containing protein [Halobacillus yeomjeoni]|uniref:DUF4003 family protein n=1 Tax=Halobacillus yeomjeoni TaxID=311194 RepID=UPI001CD1C816|nr:DUF4003 family protein [Halobacillus yeomjeoni]MCA0984356.1 DUF4003 domain-containing protein [Halobacillus yeomjeoni]